MINIINKIIFLRILRWKIKGTIPDDKKIIAIVAPHTSAYDFIIALIARSVLKMEKRIKFLGKAELFKNRIFGFILRKLGGYSVDRSKNNNMVDAVVDIFNSKTEFFITIGPEGTRKKVNKLKTGFYYIALKARVPILMIGLDFKKKMIQISELFNVSGNIKEDMKFILNFFKPFDGKIPENGLKHI